MIEALNWFVIFCALFGAYLNSKQDIRGFKVWIFTNSYLSAYNFATGELAQGFLFATYLVITINGLVSWKKKS